MPTPARNKLASLPWFAIAFCLCGAYALTARLSSHLLLTFYEDDAFYYFQIARNIATHHGSTFDGIHATNGYHPLWLLTLTALRFLSTGKAFFILLQLTTLLCFIATFLIARATFRHITGNPTLAQLAAAIVSLESLLLFRGGMEIILTIPLALLLCHYRLRPNFRWSASSATLYGLLGAAIILSRLDTIFFILPLFFLELSLDRPSTLQAWVQRLYAAISCAVPVLLYALSNHLWFHTWTPISGQAKQLRWHHFLSSQTIATSLESLYSPYRILVIYPTLLILLLCLITSLKKSPRRPVLILALSLITLPFLQALAFWTLSDWPIWPWYIYSLPLASTGALLLILDRFPHLILRKDGLLLLQAAVLLLTFVYASSCTPGTALSTGYVFGKDLEQFSQTHPGLYAMGDYAGIPGYLLNQPLIQLEGLVMDAPFLTNIRTQANLNEVLAAQNIRYYATPDAVLINGCYQTKEPFQAGPDSPHMRGSFCRQPIATFRHGSSPRSTLMIFEIHP